MEAPVSHRRASNVRIGPISVITLIVVICMAVLAVLSASTANATMIISQRSADSTTEQYLNELAAQEFVASLDDMLVDLRDAGASAEEAAEAIAERLDDLRQAAEKAADGRITASAEVEGTNVKAQFTGETTRQLNIVVSVQDDVSTRIEKWKATAVQQEMPGTGNLWAGA